MSNTEIKYAKSFRQQFTIRGMILGAIGSMVITMSSMYVALRMGALPWPTVFVAVVSMLFLKLFRNTNINEINVTHTAMSAGAMVAGGVAFTIPGIYILNPEAEFGSFALLFSVFGGVILGLIFTALIRKYFVVKLELPYPMGIAASETLLAGDRGGKTAAVLGGTMLFTIVFTTIRDWFGKIPSVLSNGFFNGKGIPVDLWVSPMAIAIGYLVGPVAVGVWFIGALIGFIGISYIGVQIGFFTDAGAAEAFRASLGIGVMVGTGIGILVKGILPKAKEIYGSMFFSNQSEDALIRFRWAPIVFVLLAAGFTWIVHMPLLASIVTILGVWLTTSMSAQITGQTGINPMEIFAIIVLLVAKVISQLGELEAFFIAAIVAVACGLAGDVMNDFKSGHILKTNPKAQWFAQCIGALVGAGVAVVAFYAMLRGFGEIGPGTALPAPQATVVATMVGGLPDVTAFVIGLIAGALLYIFNIPAMTLGLGIYLPTYITLTVFIGGVIRFIIDKVNPSFAKKDTGVIVASGLLGGEGITGVTIAIIRSIQGMFL